MLQSAWPPSRSFVAVSDVPRDELTELKSVFCKIFDLDMSPLGFDARQMYQFISERY